MCSAIKKNGNFTISSDMRHLTEVHRRAAMQAPGTVQVLAAASMVSAVETMAAIRSTILKAATWTTF